MLVIRNEQMDIFRKKAIEQFVNRTASWLREDYPEQTTPMDDTELQDLIHLGIKRAKEYGIEIEYDVGRYIEFMLKFGKDFVDQPWAKPYFYRRPLQYPTQMLDLLEAAGETHGQSE